MEAERVYDVTEIAQYLGLPARGLKAAILSGLLPPADRNAGGTFASSGFSQSWVAALNRGDLDNARAYGLAAFPAVREVPLGGGRVAKVLREDIFERALRASERDPAV